MSDGTDKLCLALYGRLAKAADYLGGSNAKMLHDAADRIEALKQVGAGAIPGVLPVQRGSEGVSDRPTPETDAAEFRAYTTPDNSSRACVSAIFARRFERERDEALEALQKAAWDALEMMSQRDELRAESARLQMQADGMVDAEIVRQLRAEVERLRDALSDIANMPEYDQDDEHRLRHKARKALAGKEGDCVTLSCVGKKAAGRLLEGREHSEFPKTKVRRGPEGRCLHRMVRRCKGTLD
jgi:vacuolar-type H+-ATPase subunit E/Vma4